MKNILNAIFLAFLFLPPLVMANPKYDANDPIQLYCGVIESIATAVGQARDRKMSPDKLLRQILNIDFVKSNAQLQTDAKEIVNFMYVIAPDKPVDRLVRFIADRWCMKQLSH